jgi:hypothetical protein
MSTQPTQYRTGQPLPAAWVDRLFSRFLAIYGAQKVGAMWSGADLAEVKTVWGEQLGRFAPATIGAALLARVDSGDAWPPTLPEFVESCRQAANARRASDPRLLLAAPGETFTDNETAKANLERVREMLAGIGKARS